MKEQYVARCLDNQSKKINISYPETVDEIKQLINYCNQHKKCFYPVSSGNNWGYGSSFPVEEETPVIMNLSKMPAVISFDEEEGLLTFGPGLTQQKLYDFLKSNNHNFMVPVTGAGPEANIMGNALERGFGITPVHDHVESVRSVKAILPDGSTYSSSFDQLGLSVLDKHHKWSVGSNFDYIFFQSNFGVVYEMTIKLERIPESIVLFSISITNDQLKDGLRQVKSIKEIYKGFISGINVMNSRRVMAMKTNYLVGVDGYCDDEQLAKLQKKNKLKDWQILGAIYGPKSITSSIQRDIKKKIKGIGSNKKFLSSNHFILSNSQVGNFILGKEDYATIKEAFSILKGKPSRYPLNLIYVNRDFTKTKKQHHPIKDNVGIIWFAPVLPFKIELMQKYHDSMMALFKKYSMEPILTFTVQNENVVAVTMPLLFDKNDPSKVENAHDLYRELLEESLRHRVYPYRLPTIFHKDFLEKIDWENSLAAKLKSTIDPNNILAPNRYSKF